ncbi:MAG: Fic family protein [Burkholderiales bacterium]
MKRAATGVYERSSVGGEVVRAFIPHPLPPKPSLQLGSAVRDRLDAALLALGRLDGVSGLLPDVQLFLYAYVRKEAVLSSQIEGTQSTLADLLLFELEEAPGVPLDDVVEVSNYVRATEHGLRRLREGLPLSNRLLREIHEVLLSRGRGAGKAPGKFRRTQNWIGGSRPGNARFVPPPPQQVPEAMGALEKFLHDQPERTSPLLKAALSHVQFETIHPFLDGNGRVGRLLITLLLCAEGVLGQPLLYLSLYFKQHRSRYYDLLDAVRSAGDWEGWVEFFAQGVAETAEGAVATARRLLDVAQRDREKIRNRGRSAGSAEVVHHALQRMPVCTVARLAKTTKLTLPTVLKALDALEGLRIVREVTGKQRHRIYHYDGYMRVLNEGTDPL